MGSYLYIFLEGENTMYTELIQKIISAIDADRTDIVQMHLSNLLMTDRCEEGTYCRDPRKQGCIW